MKCIAVIFIAFISFHCSKSPNDKITIKVVHWGGFMEKDWREKFIAPFEQAHPNIKIELDIVPYGLYMQRLLAAAVSGAAVGDVLLVDDWLAVELISRKYALSLQDRADRDLKLADFYPDLISEWKRFGSGTLSGIPFSAGATVLFYNPMLFDQSHVSYPDSSWTYDDMHRAAKAITRDTNGDGVPDVWGMLSDNGGFSGMDTYIYAQGGTELSPDCMQPTFAHDEAIAAIQQWVDMTRIEHLSPQPSSLTTEHQQMFASNRVGMMLIGDHFSKMEKFSDKKWDFVLPPKGTAGRFSRRFDDGFIIPKSCEHPDEAWEFLKYAVTFPPQSGITTVMEKSTPAYKPLATSAAWYTGTGEARGKMLNDIFDHYSFTFIGPGWNEWRDNIFVPEIDNAFLGRKTVYQAMHDAASKVEEVLGRRGR